MKISIQGVFGSYSHIASEHLFGQNHEYETRGSFTEVFEDLENDVADCIVVPIENSTYGSIYTNYDNISKYTHPIIAEIYVKINFHLIAHPGTKKEDITQIHVHPVALGQIQNFIKENKHIIVHEHEDTAGAIKMIQEKNLTNAAGAASVRAAEIYNMEIIQENIHENPKNYTRFYVIAKNKNIFDVHKTLKIVETETKKATIQFQLGSQAGSLYKALRAFADRNIELTKIESRPVKNTDWEYTFYIDVIYEDGKIEIFNNAYKELSEYVTNLSTLGIYTKGISIVS